MLRLSPLAMPPVPAALKFTQGFPGRRVNSQLAPYPPPPFLGTPRAHEAIALNVDSDRLQSRWKRCLLEHPRCPLMGGSQDDGGEGGVGAALAISCTPEQAP